MAEKWDYGHLDNRLIRVLCVSSVQRVLLVKCRILIHYTFTYILVNIWGRASLLKYNYIGEFHYRYQIWQTSPSITKFWVAAGWNVSQSTWVNKSGPAYSLSAGISALFWLKSWHQLKFNLDGKLNRTWLNFFFGGIQTISLFIRTQGGENTK